MSNPLIKAPLDVDFRPAILFNRNYEAKVAATNRVEKVVLSLEREKGLITRYEVAILAEPDPDTSIYIERLVKFLLWSRGGWKIHFSGPDDLGERIRDTYSLSGARRFDCEMMAKAYGKEFEVLLTGLDQVPASVEANVSAGGHMQGCRIGFDLGASDYKVSAIIDGETVFTAETPWDPKNAADPRHNYHHLSSALHRAAAHLPRVDAIGGSSAGIIVNDEIRVASLLRSIPEDQYAEAAGVFHKITKEWNVPLTVMNDGDVTALAGALSLKKKGMLGLAMGSSEATGFMDKNGSILGWLNELAFAPVDYNESAVKDEWSQDRGVGAMYFSQQAVNKLIPAAGISLPEEMGLPERLVEVQKLMRTGDPRAGKIYETIGVYLGYTIPHYLSFYDFEHILILGRVTTGSGGDIVLMKAREVLAEEFPEIAARVTIHVPDEKTRRVGQAVAAASLPSTHIK